MHRNISYFPRKLGFGADSKILSTNPYRFGRGVVSSNNTSSKFLAQPLVASQQAVFWTENLFDLSELIMCRFFYKPTLFLV